LILESRENTGSIFLLSLNTTVTGVNTHITGKRYARLVTTGPGMVFFRRKHMVARPDIILLVLDTQRRDRLSCYGYPRETTPKER
jgi:glucan phosphoethanolaminetransferase (alkaline phosphatase superfamily)